MEREDAEPRKARPLADASGNRLIKKETYEQNFAFDEAGLGNMVKKTSTESVTPKKTIGDNLNYTFDYVYDPNYSHRLINAGNMYYQYDANGNVTCEQDGSFESNGDDLNYRKISV